MQQALRHKVIDVVGTVLKIRKDRNGMVQTEVSVHSYLIKWPFKEMSYWIGTISIALQMHRVLRAQRTSSLPFYWWAFSKFHRVPVHWQSFVVIIRWRLLIPDQTTSLICIFITTWYTWLINIWPKINIRIVNKFIEHWSLPSYWHILSRNFRSHSLISRMNVISQSVGFLCQLASSPDVW